MAIYFGHENWNLALNIMVGLRKSIKALYQLNSFTQIKQEHFTEEHQFMLGNKSINGTSVQVFKNMEVFKFIQIAPIVFERLRGSYGVSNTDYQRSVGPETLLNHLLTGNLTSLNQQCSSGKSGAFFYLTLDNKIFLKTIPKREFIFFTKILKNYYEHMRNHTNTLVVRTYGLYKLKIFVNKEKINTIYFVSMQNIFSKVKNVQGFKIEQVYDLKGSLYDRNGKEGKQLKDNDWIDKKKKICLPKQIGQKFKAQIKTDSKFFKKNNINDYSLMVAIVRYDEQKFKQNDATTNEFKNFHGGIRSTTSNIMYVLTIIDILTVFETRKNLEYFFKSTFLSKDVSCIPPNDYCNRFRQFINDSVE